MKQFSGQKRFAEFRERLDDRFGRGIAVSAGVHVALAAMAIAVPGLFPAMGDSIWGDPDASGGIRVSLSADSGGIALPRAEVVSETAAGNDSEGFFDDEPPPPAAPAETPAPEAEAELIPESPSPVEAAPPPPPPVREAPEPVAPEPPAAPASVSPAPAVRAPDRPAPPDRPDNAIPFGDSGQLDLPSGQPGTGEGTGVSMGDGAFGSEYGAYVESIRSRISGNWIQGTIPLNVRTAGRVYVAFEIERDGTITDIRIEQSSGNDEVDRSARRAVFASNRLAPLPRGYRGQTVSVRFWFELRR